LKALYHTLEEIEKFCAHLKPGETMTSTLTKFLSLRYANEAKFAYSYDDLITHVAEAKAGDIIFVKGEKFYEADQISGWDIRNRNQMANALRSNPSILGVKVPSGVNLKIILNLEEIPYLLNDVENGKLVSQNIVTITLITHNDFIG